jgi:hypothetical protein
MQKLTQEDVERAIWEDERHLGWGLAISENLNENLQGRLHRAVAKQATKLGLTYDELFHWTNSKLGRWTVDGVYGCDMSPTAAVAAYMTAEQVAEVQA